MCHNGPSKAYCNGTCDTGYRLQKPAMYFPFTTDLMALNCSSNIVLTLDIDCVTFGFTYRISRRTFSRDWFSSSGQGWHIFTYLGSWKMNVRKYAIKKKCPFDMFSTSKSYFVMHNRCDSSEKPPMPKSSKMARNAEEAVCQWETVLVYLLDLPLTSLCLRAYTL